MPFSVLADFTDIKIVKIGQLSMDTRSTYFTSLTNRNPMYWSADEGSMPPRIKT